mgnify:CR=1 FL=1
MFRRFFPKDYKDSVNHIDYQKLLSMGIDSLIFDIDNTLAPPKIKEASKELIVLFNKLKKMGFKICLLSNNNKLRVETFNNNLKLNSVYAAKKPLLFGINRALKILDSKEGKCCIIGDQIFTDVWVGNRKKIYTILVKPISPRTEFPVILKRLPEKLIINYYLKHRK